MGPGLKLAQSEWILELCYKRGAAKLGEYQLGSATDDSLEGAFPRSKPKQNLCKTETTTSWGCSLSSWMQLCLNSSSLLHSLHELINNDYCHKPIGFDICHLQPRESYDCLPLHLIDKDIEGPKRGGHLSTVTEQACGEIQCDLIFVFSKHTLGKALKKKKVQVANVGIRK